jgi:hypothetical protein
MTFGLVLLNERRHARLKWSSLGFPADVDADALAHAQPR